MVSLPAHVSRSSSDYAPHGWSYKAEKTIFVGTALTVTTIIPLLRADDTDYFIESAQYSVIGATMGVGQFFTMNLETYNNAATPAAVSPARPLCSVPAAPLGINALLWTDFAINQNEVLTDGNQLVLNMVETGTTASITGLTIQIRYRRKA